MEILQELYEVVKNIEEQYSIWPQNKEVPSGWKKVGYSGEKDVCLKHIEQVWTDMRPLSLRKHIESMKTSSRVNNERLQTDTESLVDLLLNKDVHAVSLPYQPVDMPDFLDQLRSGICYIEFNEVFSQPQIAISLTSENYELNANYILFKGSLTLDLIPIQCHCKFDSKNFRGTCRVKKI